MANLYTSLFAIRASLVIPVECINAQVTHGALHFLGIPYYPVRYIGAGLKTLPGANAFCFIYEPYVAIGSIDMARAGGTGLNACGGNALPAGEKVYVIGEFLIGV